MRLEAQRLTTGYETLEVVRDVSLGVEEDECVALVGTVGAGKSALMGAIAGTLPVRSGRVAIDGEDVTSLPAHERVQRGLALVPEGRRLFAGMTVAENLWAGAYTARASEAKRRLDSVLEIFPLLASRQRQQVGTLSGGEQQMCAIARALMSGPTILLIDELTLGLAPVMHGHLLRALADVRAGGASLLIVDQDVERLLRYADRAYLLQNGSVAMSGNASDLLANSLFGSEYLGLT